MRDNIVVCKKKKNFFFQFFINIVLVLSRPGRLVIIIEIVGKRQ